MSFLQTQIFYSKQIYFSVLVDHNIRQIDVPRSRRVASGHPPARLLAPRPLHPPHRSWTPPLPPPRPRGVYSPGEAYRGAVCRLWGGREGTDPPRGAAWKKYVCNYRWDRLNYCLSVISDRGWRIEMCIAKFELESFYFKGDVKKI